MLLNKGGKECFNKKKKEKGKILKNIKRNNKLKIQYYKELKKS